MSFNIVTRGNAMANVSARKLGSKRSFSGSYVTVEKESPTTSRFKKDAVKPMSNPWTRRRNNSKGGKVVELVRAEENGEEVPSDGDEEWKEVKSRRKVNRPEVSYPKPAQAEVNMPSGMQYDVDWPVLMKVGTPVRFRGLIKSGSLNGTAGVIVSVVEANKRFVVTTEEGMKVSVAAEKLECRDDDDILCLEEGLVTPRQNLDFAEALVNLNTKVGGSEIALAGGEIVYSG